MHALLLPTGLAICAGRDHDRRMRLIIHRADGSCRPGILLALIGARIRVSIPGCDDAVEFRLTDGRWLGEAGEPVMIRFNVAAYEFDALVQRAVPQYEDLPAGLDGARGDRRVA